MTATASMLKVLYSAVAASVGVSVVFSITIFGAIRSSDRRRADRTNAAAAYATLSACGLLAFLGIVVYGLILVGQKG